MLIIETKNLSKHYGDKHSVEEVNLHIEAGTIYGLLGRNGAGKTTILRMILNLVKPTKGEIKLFGKHHHSNLKEIYHRIGSLIENPGFYQNLTGEENLKILTKIRGIHRKDAIHQALSVVNLLEEKNKLYQDYSLGMKQRLGIAAAILHEPELLILDEPINGLDPVGIHEIRQYLLKLSKEKGTTILISSHILSEIEQIADTIGVIHEGQLIEEIDMEELRKRRRQFVEFEVSDENKACFVLEEILNIYDYKVQEKGKIRLFCEFNERGKINQLFVENKITVERICMSEETLEDYFSKLIGGGRIG